MVPESIILIDKAVAVAEVVVKRVVPGGMFSPSVCGLLVIGYQLAEHPVTSAPPAVVTSPVPLFVYRGTQ